MRQYLNTLKGRSFQTYPTFGIVYELGPKDRASIRLKEYLASELLCSQFRAGGV